MTYGPTPLTLGTFDLYWMAVDPKAQGHGIGKALVRWLEEHVRRARRPTDRHRNVING